MLGLYLKYFYYLGGGGALLTADYRDVSNLHLTVLAQQTLGEAPETPGSPRSHMAQRRGQPCKALSRAQLLTVTL